MCHSASGNDGRSVAARYVSFATLFHPAAIGTTLVAEDGRGSVAPAERKFSARFRANLGERLAGGGEAGAALAARLLDWRLPLYVEGVEARL